MRKADILKAMETGTPVAVGGSRYGNEYPRYAKEGIVVAVDQKRRVYSGGRDFYGHIVEDGIRVRPLDGKRLNYGKEPIVHTTGSMLRGDVYDSETEDRIFSSREVIDTWEDYVAHHRSEVQHQRAQEQRAADQKAKCEAAVEALRAAGVNAEVDYYISHSGPTVYRGVRISAENGQFLAQAASVVASLSGDDQLAAEGK